MEPIEKLCNGLEADWNYLGDGDEIKALQAVIAAQSLKIVDAAVWDKMVEALDRAGGVLFELDNLAMLKVVGAALAAARDAEVGE